MMSSKYVGLSHEASSKAQADLNSELRRCNVLRGYAEIEVDVEDGQVKVLIPHPSYNTVYLDTLYTRLANHFKLGLRCTKQDVDNALMRRFDEIVESL
jgi:hypothetical protein